MSFHAYISNLRNTNRDLFDAEKISLTPKSLENAIEAAFRAGEKSALEAIRGDYTENPFEKIFSTCRRS